MSQPARAVWIEIGSTIRTPRYKRGHSLRGLCGLKSPGTGILAGAAASQPARAVWIEMVQLSTKSRVTLVTACEGCVD